MRRLLLAALLLPALAPAQFVLQQSNSTASLRGVSNIDGKTAWASGTEGTVLRTLDGGAHWSRCATPPGADTLDFRGIVAMDADRAIVMSSGKGDLSRIYRTADGCRTWKLAFTNPAAPDGFFDALYFTRRDELWLLGDPVKGYFYLANTQDGGATWREVKAPGLALPAQKSIGAFAASNQSLAISTSGPLFGGGGGYLYRGHWTRCPDSTQYNDPQDCLSHVNFSAVPLPVGGDAESSGIFAVFATPDAVVAVGGDYKSPDKAVNIAAFSADQGASWESSQTQPHGYRSSVAYDVNTRTWIAVGPNGTDISIDEGSHWKPLKPEAARGDAADADRNWNALSLPFVVGPKGRIGRLREDALPKR